MKEKETQTKQHSTLYLSDGTELNLLDIPDDLRDRLAQNWSLCTARIRDNAGTYRFVNYLTGIGLLADRRDTMGKGWRKLSYVDCIYLELVLALRKMGVKSDTIKYLYNTFQEPYSKGHTDYLQLDWLDILIAIHCGTEMEVLINSDETIPTIISDPQLMSLVGTKATDGQIRVSLSVMVNKVRKMNGMEPITIKHHFGQLGLNDAEVETVKDIRKLENNETLTVKKQKKGTLIERTSQEKTSEELARVLGKLVGENFGSINAQVEGGKVTSIQRSAKKVIPNE